MPELGAGHGGHDCYRWGVLVSKPEGSHKFLSYQQKPCYSGHHLAEWRVELKSIKKKNFSSEELCLDT